MLIKFRKAIWEALSPIPILHLCMCDVLSVPWGAEGNLVKRQWGGGGVNSHTHCECLQEVKQVKTPVS